MSRSRPELCAGVANGEHLGVSGRVLVAQRAIAGDSDDFAIARDRRADGNLIRREGGAGGVEGGGEGVGHSL